MHFHSVGNNGRNFRILAADSFGHFFHGVERNAYFKFAIVICVRFCRLVTGRKWKYGKN